MQKKGLLFIFILLITMTLCSCLTTIHPNMVEYSKEEVLEIAKEKYHIKSFIFDENKLTESQISREDLSNSNFKIVNPDNLDVCFSSFAGKNGGHDIQGMYMFFVAYYALGMNENDEAKFIFYNVNLDKDAEIIDTIGCSDYPYDVLPNEIPTKIKTLFQTIHYDTLRLELYDKFQSFYMDELNYTKEHLSIQYGKDKYIEFYKEDGALVYDYYKYSSSIEDWILYYSSSKKYGILYYQYGVEYSSLFDISFSVEKYSNGLDLLEAQVQLKEESIPGEILYSSFVTRITYKVLPNSEIIEHTNTISSNEKTLNHSLLINKLEGIDHQNTTKVYLSDYYIFYLVS